MFALLFAIVHISRYPVKSSTDNPRALGVAVFDDAGEFRGLQVVLSETQKALSNLTAEEQASYMSKIAGTNYYTEMSYLLDAVSEKAD